MAQVVDCVALCIVWSILFMTIGCIRQGTVPAVDADTVSEYYRGINRLFGNTGGVLPVKDTKQFGDNEDIYLYTSDSFPKEARNRPSIANGHLGTVVHHDVVHMNGLYNGRLTASHRAIIPSTVNVNISRIVPGNGDTKRHYALNAHDGLYQENLLSGDVTVYFRLFAQRTIASLLVLEIEAEGKSSTQSEYSIYINNSNWTTSPDITFLEQSSGRNNTRYHAGMINDPETDTSGHTQVHVLYDVIPDVLHSNKRHMTWTFLTSIHVTKAAAFKGYDMGIQALQSKTLMDSHVTAWNALWSRGTIELSGDIQLARMTTGSLYYLLSSIPIVEDPEWPYFGLSPNGLPWGQKGVAYWGSVFWDQDTWTFPPITALHTDMGKMLMDRRKHTKDAAKENAKNYGYKGLKYPWESRYTGIETTGWKTAATNELHVNGDVAFGIMQYYWATGNVTMFRKDVYYDVIIGLADFWISKLKYNATMKKYVTTHVCGPDEYHHDVNNSVYINVVAKLTLEAAYNVTKLRRMYLDDNKIFSGDKYKYYADNIYIKYDPVHNYHPEYDGYNMNITVKQADVILLGFPFMYPMVEELRRNDMAIYEQHTDVNGPAMTWSMFAVNWLELGDEKKAFDNMKKMYGNVASPFQVWSEEIDDRGAPHFITGQGGFLQAILFGYGGFRIRQDRLDLDFKMPPNVTKILVKGFDYLGSSIHFMATADHVDVTLVKFKGPSLRLHHDGIVDSLPLGHTVRISRKKAYITG